MKVDLHIHSIYSADGRHTVKEILELFNKGDIISITDHETIGAWDEFAYQAKLKGMLPLLGLEWFSQGCHLLSYFSQNASINEIKSYFAVMRKNESKTMIAVSESLKKIFPKFPSYDEILKQKEYPEGIVGLPSMAEEIVKISDLKLYEAEDIVRREKKKIPFRQIPLSSQDIISITHDWGGVTILAHPFRNSQGKIDRKEKNELKNQIDGLIKIGIDGLEVFSGDSNFEEETILLHIADDFNLIKTIGSDFHYEGKGKNPSLLTEIPESLINEIKLRILL